MKKNGSTNANDSVEKNTVRKMLNMPFCAYCVQMAHHLLGVRHGGLGRGVELDVALDELDRAVGAGGDRLHAGAGEPVDHRAARDQAEQERRMQQRELLDVLRSDPLVSMTMMVERSWSSRRPRPCRSAPASRSP